MTSTTARSQHGNFAVTKDPIDRKAVVKRHNVRITAPDPALPITVGNGDFAVTADITGMQTFTNYHDAAKALGGDLKAVERGNGKNVVNTATMTTWAWHEMPASVNYSLSDVMTAYPTNRGEVRYPDLTDHDAMLEGRSASDPARAAGNWLHANPQRLDLGRIGFDLRAAPGADTESDPATLANVTQTLDLWTGHLVSSFSYRGHAVTVTTVSDPSESRVAYRVEGNLLASGLASIALRFPYASDHFMATSDWDSPDKHQSVLTQVGPDAAVIARKVDDAVYVVRLGWNSGDLAQTAPHVFTLCPAGMVLELVADFSPDTTGLPAPSGFAAVAERAAKAWESFWNSGAAIDFEGSTDPRAGELERRVILSQYLTQVNCSGTQPPQETGLVMNSWQGKFHLEMHWWHAMHFAAWGRADRLERSLSWYLDTLGTARAVARSQGYEGARWPKQVGPDGRESPSDIGSLIIWQQPHLLYMIDMLIRAQPERAEPIVERFSEAIHETATFMADFVEERNGVFHLPGPLMPAQEFYDPRTTEDPTFELAYWWWGLETAQNFQEMLGLPRQPRWQRVLDNLTRPHYFEGTGTYAGIGTPPFLRKDDHPAMLLALGFVPRTPLIQADIMSATLEDAWETWDWASAWGWDYPAMAMTATRLGRPDLAVEALLLDAPKNTYLPTGHNQQMPSFLPIYLPGNGGLLSAVSLMAAGWTEGKYSPGFPAGDGWIVKHEGFIQWPA